MIINKEFSIIDIVFLILLAVGVPGICYEVGIRDARIMIFFALLVFYFYLYFYSDKQEGDKK